MLNGEGEFLGVEFVENVFISEICYNQSSGVIVPQGILF
jgi:hypothetical protein